MSPKLYVSHQRSRPTDQTNQGMKVKGLCSDMVIVPLTYVFQSDRSSVERCLDHQVSIRSANQIPHLLQLGARLFVCSSAKFLLVDAVEAHSNSDLVKVKHALEFVGTHRLVLLRVLELAQCFLEYLRGHRPAQLSRSLHRCSLRDSTVVF